MTTGTGLPTTGDTSGRPLSPVAARLLARAQREWQQRQWQAAEQSFKNVLALAPNHPQATRMLGMVAQRRGDAVRAAACFQKVLPVWPDDSDLRIGLGIALFELGKADEALVQLRKASTLAPTSVLAWFNLGEALAREARADEAMAALQRVLELDPKHVKARLSLARAHASRGRIDAAVEAFREVIRLEPGHAEGWFGLSNLNAVEFDDADTAWLQHVLKQGDMSARDRELLGFALGKALESRGEYEQAFDTFRLANTSRSQRVAWDAAGEHKRIQAIRQVFADLQLPSLDSQLGHEVIFVVSIPRSGSTLVEHILASHPEVEGANEIDCMRRIIDAETQRRGSAFPLWVPQATAADWLRLGREYLARTAQWRQTKPRFTDKSLMTWYFVGAALAMLPAARVVIVRRDPVETCLGCFRQCFSEVGGFPCTLEDTADYCSDFVQLSRFWLAKYPDRVFDLSYEALVAEPDAMIRQTLDFCGLPFHADCLDFHKTSRTVLSLPSAAQVRQPIRRDTARSSFYGDRLDSLRKRLRDAGAG